MVDPFLARNGTPQDFFSGSLNCKNFSYGSSPVKILVGAPFFNHRVLGCSIRQVSKWKTSPGL